MKNNTSVSKQTEYAEYKLEKGILHLCYTDGLNLTLEIARQTVQDRVEFLQGKSYPMLVDDRGLITIEREAGVFYSTEEAGSCILAVAIVTRSKFTLFFARFYLIMHPAPAGIPVKLFSNEDVLFSTGPFPRK